MHALIYCTVVIKQICDLKQQITWVGNIQKLLHQLRQCHDRHLTKINYIAHVTKHFFKINNQITCPNGHRVVGWKLEHKLAACPFLTFIERPHATNHLDIAFCRAVTHRRRFTLNQTLYKISISYHKYCVKISTNVNV